MNYRLDDLPGDITRGLVALANKVVDDTEPGLEIPPGEIYVVFPGGFSARILNDGDPLTSNVDLDDLDDDRDDGPEEFSEGGADRMYDNLRKQGVDLEDHIDHDHSMDG